LYIEQKNSRGVPSSDTLGALPMMSSSGSQQAQREARLQKRVSAGGRLAKAPIPER
jgi:Arf-GAP/SH3 domain/ANK repeat/PH domain-containing protein